MKNYYQVKMQKRIVYVELEATQQDEKDIKDYFKDEILNIQKLKKDEFEKIKNKRVFELTPINFNSISKNKELLNKTITSQIRLTVLQKQAEKYRDFLNSIKTQNKEVEKESIKLNPDFLKNQEEMKEEFETKSSDEKPLFISKQVEKLKDFSSKIKNKIVDFQQHKALKELEFKNLEQEIAQFQVLIEKLREENRLLRQELELLIEQKQRSSEKTKLEKENSSLKEKIEALKDKDKTSFDEETKEKKPLKINKITYSNSQEQER